MASRYSKELDHLPETYAFARTLDQASVLRFAAQSEGRPLIAIGSGGAQSVAQLACTLHEFRCGQPALAMTPFAFLRSRLRTTDVSILCISAGGRNPDILAAFDTSLQREPSALAVMCAKPESPLMRRASKHTWIHRLENELPLADGFLATHSVLAFSVLLVRALTDGMAPALRLPKSLAGLLQQRSWRAARTSLRTKMTSIWDARTVLLLHSPLLAAAAHDIESRFAEAALSNLWLSDFRNFGHGRHHWLARHGTDSAVLALAANEDEELLKRTLALLPESIPAVSMVFDGDPRRAALAALVTTIVIPEFVGRIHGIDPAKPGVPAFGRKLYRLSPKIVRSPPERDSAICAVERKIGAPLNSVATSTREAWLTAHSDYLEQLNSTRFDAMVFDYDGTLCDVDARFGNLPDDTAKLVSHLIENGVAVAIATGRGDSALKALRASIEKRYWPCLVIGLKNCSRIQTLDAEKPQWKSEANSELKQFAVRLRSYSQLRRIATIHAGSSAISIRPMEYRAFREVRHLVRTIIQLSPSTLVLRESTHSVDVLPSDVSKCAILTFLRDNRGVKSPLAIGDRGDPVGNDFDLLHACLSLSVDRVSVVPEFCWNLAPAGIRYRTATHYYLSRVRTLKAGRFRIALPGVP